MSAKISREVIARNVADRIFDRLVSELPKVGEDMDMAFYSQSIISTWLSDVKKELSPVERIAP